MTDLILKVARDISEHLHAFLQKKIRNPSKQPTVLAGMPVRISLWRYPANKLISSVELKKTISFTSQEIQTIGAYAALKHISQEDALIELLKMSLQNHKHMQEIIRQARRRYDNNTQVAIAVEVWGEVTWDEERTDNHAA